MRFTRMAVTGTALRLLLVSYMYSVGLYTTARATFVPGLHMRM
jgi:hypothetical protein